MANSNKLLGLIVVVIVVTSADARNRLGFDSFAQELESDLALEHPALLGTHMLGRVINLFFNKINTLNRFAAIVDADDMADPNDHFSQCVNHGTEDIKTAVKPTVAEFIDDCYTPLHSDFSATYKQLFETLSTVAVDEEINDVMICLKPLENLSPSELDRNMNEVLQCLTTVKFTDSKVADYVVEFAKTKEETSDGSHQKGNQCFKRLLTKLRRKTSALNDEFKKCAESRRREGLFTETHQHKEAVDEYYTKVDVKVKEYVEEMRKSLLLEKCGDTTLPSQVLVTKGEVAVRKLERAVVVEEEDWIKVHKEIFETAAEGLEGCRHGVNEIQKHLHKIRTDIEETLDMIQANMLERMVECMELDVAASAACLYDLDTNMRENYDDDIKPMMEQARLWVDKDDYAYINSRVKVCVDAVVDQAGHELDELVDKMNPTPVEEVENVAVGDVEKDEL